MIGSRAAHRARDSGDTDRTDNARIANKSSEPWNDIFIVSAISQLADLIVNGYMTVHTNTSGLTLYRINPWQHGVIDHSFAELRTPTAIVRVVGSLNPKSPSFEVDFWRVR